MIPNPFSQKVKIYTYSALALTAVITVLRTVGLLFFYDADPGYFAPHPLNSIATVLCILTVLWLLSAVIFIPKYSYPLKTAPRPHPTTQITAAVCGAAIICAAFFFRDSMYYYVAQAGMYRMLFLLSLVASLYFIQHFMGENNRAWAALSAYVVILWAALLISVSYMNLYVPMNSPMKKTFHIALLCIMLFLIEEARLHIGRHFRILSYVACLLSVLMCCVFSVPLLIAHVCDALWDTDYLIYSLLMLCFLLYIGARTRVLYRLLMDSPCMTAEEIAADKARILQEKQKEKEKKQRRAAAADPDTAPETDTKEGDEKHDS